MKRREFIQKTLAGMAASTIARGSLFSSSQEFHRNTEFPFPYDSFDSAERIFFDNQTLWLNILPKQGKNLDIRLYVSDTSQGIYRKLPQELLVRHGEIESQNIPIDYSDSPKLFYKIEYREGKKPWKSCAPREVKTPNVDLEKGGKVKIILWGDDHVYGDLRYQPKDKEWKKDFLKGDYVSRILEEIIRDPSYEPHFVNELKVIGGFTWAWTLKYILETRPDFVIGLGDTVGPDSYGVWGAQGQWANKLQPKNALEKQAKILWERTRRTLAPISPEIPFYLVSGNHDGENGWEDFTDHSRKQRDRLLKLPKFLPGHFTPVYSPHERNSISSVSHDRKFSLFPESYGNHYTINWAKGDIQFIALTPFRYVLRKPRKVTDWTLGETQKKILKTHLKWSFGVPWKFICLHHTVGGYPFGPKTLPGAYGRGPLFTRKDYEKANEMAKMIDHNAAFEPDKVEQIWLTQKAKEFNTRGLFYGHDHVYFMKNIGKTSLNNEMVGVCAGSTKLTGGGLPGTLWSNPYWMEFYGAYYQTPPPFLTPPGITEVEIGWNKATIKYVCTAPSGFMDFNMLPGIMPGEVLRKYTLYR
jgi:hypothetical protein